MAAIPLSAFAAPHKTRALLRTLVRPGLDGTLPLLSPSRHVGGQGAPPSGPTALWPCVAQLARTHAPLRGACPPKAFRHSVPCVAQLPRTHAPLLGALPPPGAARHSVPEHAALLQPACCRRPKPSRTHARTRPLLNHAALCNLGCCRQHTLAPSCGVRVPDRPCVLPYGHWRCPMRPPPNAPSAPSPPVLLQPHALPSTPLG